MPDGAISTVPVPFFLTPSTFDGRQWLVEHSPTSRRLGNIHKAIAFAVVLAALAAIFLIASGKAALTTFLFLLSAGWLYRLLRRSAAGAHAARALTFSNGKYELCTLNPRAILAQADHVSLTLHEVRVEDVAVMPRWHGMAVLCTCGEESIVLAAQKTQAHLRDARRRWPDWLRSIPVTSGEPFDFVGAIRMGVRRAATEDPAPSSPPRSPS